MNSITLDAHAKVNLFLKVLNKRKDSYHNIHTIFQRISITDKIKILKTPEGISVSSDKPITKDQRKNLAYRAALTVLDKARIESGVNIKITKRIPIGAGLGGGSSDAAAVLTGVNKLFGSPLSRRELLKVSAGIGSDVPFFISNHPFALGRSRGERLKSLNVKKRLWNLVIYPGFRVMTAGIYKTFDASSGRLTRKYCNAKIKLPLKLPMDFRRLEAMLYNDLEDIVVSKKDIVGSIIKRLASLLGKRAIVSGSGPSVFCLYETRKEAVEAKRRVLRSIAGPSTGPWQVFVARTC
jgi:4-diphosphocytidyl-2-C-methyl-D-erythritol kinase